MLSQHKEKGIIEGFEVAVNWEEAEEMWAVVVSLRGFYDELFAEMSVQSWLGDCERKEVWEGEKTLKERGKGHPHLEPDLLWHLLHHSYFLNNCVEFICNKK